jgi:hypothetical protein
MPPTIRRSHGSCEDPAGLKNPRSVPAPDGVGPLVKASPDRDPGAAPLAGLAAPAPCGAVVEVVAAWPSWPCVVVGDVEVGDVGMVVEVVVVPSCGAVLDVGVRVVDVVDVVDVVEVVDVVDVVEVVVVPSCGSVLDVGDKVVEVVVPCSTVVVVVARVVVGTWQGSYQNTLYLSSDPIEPVTSTSTLM